MCSPEQTRANIVRTMSLLNRDPVDPPDMCNPISPEDVVSLWEWEFFSHFDMDNMDASTFDALEALQVNPGSLERPGGIALT